MIADIIIKWTWWWLLLLPIAAFFNGFGSAAGKDFWSRKR